MVMTDSGSSGRIKTERFTELLSAARSGDRDALGRLLQWYANYLGILASTQLDRRLRRRLNPSDIVQEAMLAAHRDFPAFRGQTQGELLCWLRAILINVLHRSFDRHVKVEKRDIRREISIDEVSIRMEESATKMAALLPAQCDSPSAALRAKERGLELADQLSKLKPDYRDVIVLRIVKGLSFEEIAHEMGRSNGAVRMLWLRALDSFKSQEEETGGLGQSN